MIGAKKKGDKGGLAALGLERIPSTMTAANIPAIGSSNSVPTLINKLPLGQIGNSNAKSVDALSLNKKPLPGISNPLPLGKSADPLLNRTDSRDKDNETREEVEVRSKSKVSRLKSAVSDSGDFSLTPKRNTPTEDEEESKKKRSEDNAVVRTKKSESGSSQSNRQSSSSSSSNKHSSNTNQAEKEIRSKRSRDQSDVDTPRKDENEYSERDKAKRTSSSSSTRKSKEKEKPHHTAKQAFMMEAPSSPLSDTIGNEEDGVLTFDPDADDSVHSETIYPPKKARDNINDMIYSKKVNTVISSDSSSSEEDVEVEVLRSKQKKSHASADKNSKAKQKHKSSKREEDEEEVSWSANSSESEERASVGGGFDTSSEDESHGKKANKKQTMTKQTSKPKMEVINSPPLKYATKKPAIVIHSGDSDRELDE